MAVARQVQIGRTEDAAFAIQRDVIVDPSTGRAATVEKVTVAVPTEDGNVAIVQQQRVRLVDTGIEAPRQSQPRAVTYQSTPVYEGSTGGVGSDEGVNHCLHCCITLFCPCWIFMWILLCCVYGC